MMILRTILLCLSFLFTVQFAQAQEPPRYLTLELFTNTPCPICASQNPGLFSRLQNYENEFHLISFYPGKPYSSCIFYQANIAENTTRLNHYQGNIFGSPTVVLNGTEFRSSSQVTDHVLSSMTGGTSWLYVDVNESNDATRDVEIVLQDHGVASPNGGKLFAVIVERQVNYNAPNGETIHHNVFRKFLSSPDGDDVILTEGTAIVNYQYSNEVGWDENETYVIAWLMNPETEEIYNSGTKFDPDFTTSTDPVVATTPLVVYPNPATDNIQVQIPEIYTGGVLTIYSGNGMKVLREENVIYPLTTVSVKTLTAGKYFVSLSKNNERIISAIEVVH